MAVRKPEPITTGERRWGGGDGLPSPTSPLDRALHVSVTPSPRGWRHRVGDAGGVGLGILAALEKSDVSPMARAHVSAPIAIASPRRGGGRLEVSELVCSGRCATSFCGGGGGGGGETEFRVADFLSCCYLCRRRLAGKDIYMYRGEKAFCSMECRYQQIVNEEYQEAEKCGASEISSKPPEIAAGSPYSGERIFFTGIVAA